MSCCEPEARNDVIVPYMSKGMGRRSIDFNQTKEILFFKKKLRKEDEDVEYPDSLFELKKATLATVSIDDPKEG